MLKFLLKLWPAAIPLVLYLLWRLFRQGKEADEKLSAAESRLWTATLILSLLIAAGCIVVFGVSTGESITGDYTRPAQHRIGEE